MPQVRSQEVHHLLRADCIIPQGLSFDKPCSNLAVTHFAVDSLRGVSLKASIGLTAVERCALPPLECKNQCLHATESPAAAVRVMPYAKVGNHKLLKLAAGLLHNQQ